MKQKKILIGIIIIAAIVAAVFYVKSQMKSLLPETGGVSIGKVKGNPKARIQIVEYSDFQCPACQRVQPVLDELYAKYSKDVAITFYHFPLEGHIWAGVAHQAAECANRQGAFWRYHDLLYDGQKSWSGPANPINTFVRYAKSLQLDMEVFGACMTDEKVMKGILAERQKGINQKVQSTPTIFINEERVVGPVQLKMQGEKIIRKQLGLEPLVAEKE